jgi:hypothetical protein
MEHRWFVVAVFFVLWGFMNRQRLAGAKNTVTKKVNPAA